MRAKKSAALSQPDRLVRRSEADIRKYADSAEAKATAKRLKASGPDPTDADLEEIPALTDKELAAMRPVKQAITVRLDSDIVAWLKQSSGRYQTRMNAILRAVMLRQRR